MSDKPKVRISQCMIVKNEENNIERALSWGKDIMCEQIVVDTGSDDKTAEIAKRMGARVEFFKWINDFAAAKNYAIEKANGDWIAFLDADEYMSKEDSIKVLEHISNFIEKYGVENQPDAISCKLIDLNTDNTIAGIGRQSRFFRNNGIKYIGKIHERLYKQGSYNVKTIEDIQILHTGYQKEAVLHHKKGSRNVELIENELINNPNSFELQSYLVDSLLLYEEEARIEGNDELISEIQSKIKTYSQNCMAHLDEKWNYQRKIALAKVYFFNILRNSYEEFSENANWAYEKCKKVMPKNGDIDYFIGVIYLDHKKYENALIYFERSFKKLKIAGVDETDNNSFLKANLSQVYYIVSVIYYQKSVLSQSLKYMLMALNLDKFNVEKTIFTINLIKETTKENFEKNLGGILENIYDYTFLKEKIYIYSIAKKLGFDNYCENIEKSFNAEEKDIVKNLI